MSNKAISVARDLKLIPVELIASFGKVGLNVIMETFKTPEPFPATPGTIIAEYSGQNGVYTSKIEFSASAKSMEIESVFVLFSATDLVATYIDDHGNLRVAGSPEYPARLTYKRAGASIVGELTAKSDSPDGYVRPASPS